MTDEYVRRTFGRGASMDSSSDESMDAKQIKSGQSVVGAHNI